MARNENLPVRQQRDYWLSPPRHTGMGSSNLFAADSPWQMMRQMQADMERLFDAVLPGTGSMTPWQGGRGAGQRQMWNPSIDVSEDAKEYCVEVDLPGVQKDSISVDVRGGQLSIRAEMREESPESPVSDENKNTQQEKQYHMRERRYGMFSRTFTLPDDVMDDQIRCEFRDGVLTCHLPKSERQSEARRIPVGDGEPSQIPPAAQGRGSTVDQTSEVGPAEGRKRKAA